MPDCDCDQKSMLNTTVIIRCAVLHYCYGPRFSAANYSDFRGPVCNIITTPLPAGIILAYRLQKGAKLWQKYAPNLTFTARTLQKKFSGLEALNPTLSGEGAFPSLQPSFPVAASPYFLAVGRVQMCMDPAPLFHCHAATHDL